MAKNSVYPQECLSPVATGNGREFDFRKHKNRGTFVPQSKPVTVDVLVVLQNHLIFLRGYLSAASQCRKRG